MNKINAILNSKQLIQESDQLPALLQKPNSVCVDWIESKSTDKVETFEIGLLLDRLLESR